MLEEINKKIEEELKKLLNKSELTVEEIVCLSNERFRLENIKKDEEAKAKSEESRKAIAGIMENMSNL